MNTQDLLFLETTTTTTTSATREMLGPVDLKLTRKGHWTITVKDRGMLRARLQRRGGIVDFDGAGGMQAQWLREPLQEDVDAELWINAADRDRVLCLDRSSPGAFPRTVSRAEAMLTSACRFRLIAEATEGPLITTEMSSKASYLSADEVAAFARDGYVVKRGAADVARVDDALRLINRELMQNGGQYKSDGGYCESLKQHDIILATLFESPDAVGAATQLTGRLTPRRAAQIALREPAAHTKTDPKDLSRKWHTDGMAKNDPAPFSVLVGVALSDQSEPGRGNFMVYPGTHRFLFDHYKTRLATTRKLYGSNDGKDDDDDDHDDSSGKPRLGEPVSVRLAKGDVVFAHHLLAHRASTNVAPDIRYQLFFRLTRAPPAGQKRPLDHLGLPVSLFAEFDAVSSTTSDESEAD